MKLWLSLVFCMLFPLKTFAGGMPVFDTNELVGQLKDSLYLMSVIDDLLGEASGSGMDKDATNSYRHEVENLQREINKYNELNQNIEELSGAERSRSKVFIHQVKSITRHIQRVKRILTLATTVGARPEAVSSSLKVMEEKRKREKDQLEVALMALEAQDRVFQRRQKIKKERIRRDSLNRELSFIRNGQIKMPIKLRPTNSRGEEVVKKGLW